VDKAVHIMLHRHEWLSRFNAQLAVAYHNICSHDGTAFFEYTPALFGLWALFSAKAIRKFSGPLIVVSIILSFLGTKPNFDRTIFKRKTEAFQKYINQYQTTKTVSNWTEQPPAGALLPPSFVSSIGKGSVDVIPQDLALIYFNNFKYTSRTVIQSYKPYDEFLDGLGERKYLSTTAPDFVIFTNGCIDDRYCPFDESRTKLALLKKYQIKQRTSERLLLAHQAMQVELNEHKLEPIDTKLKTPIKIPASTGLIYGKINIEYSLLGKVRRFFYKPWPLYIRFKTQAGWSKRFRLIVPIAKGGVLLNKLINTTDDSALFFDREWNKISTISAIKIVQAEDGAYEQDFTIDFSELTLGK